MRATGLSAADVAQAYIATRDAFGLRALWKDIESLDGKVSAAVQSQLFVTVNQFIEHSCRWFLQHVPQPMAMDAVMARYAPAITQVEQHAHRMMSDSARRSYAQTIERLTGLGVTSALAERMAMLEIMTAACDIADAARVSKLPIAAVGRTIETLMGSREVTTYVVGGQEYKVLLQAPDSARISPYDLQNVFVRTGTGGLVPLSNVVTLSERARAQTLSRQDRVRAITITASLAPGYSLGEALDFLDRTAKEVLPQEARISYLGQSLEFRESSGALYVTFALALLVVFLVLAAQFESFIHPFVILLSTPLAVTGGLFALWFTGQTLNVFSQIGMVLLIGLMAKNGILVVEFANQLRDRGMSVRDAVLEASVVRLRPILMTSIATVLGAVPLAMATGAGAESRQALGVVIVGGITLSTIVTLYAVPALYLLLAPYTKPIGAIAAKLADLQTKPVTGHGHQAAE